MIKKGGRRPMTRDKSAMTSKPRPTMLDIAAMAGVSQATVSLILSESPSASFSDTTREKVRAAARELGYKFTPRHTAASGGQSKNRYILFIVDEFTTDPWTTLAFEGARERALEEGVDVTLNVARSRDADRVLDLHPASAVVGVIYASILTRPITPPKRLVAAKAVLVNCYDPERRLTSVLPGDLVGGRMATEHLIRTGAKRIAMITGQEEVDAARDRLTGYRQALASNDMMFDPDLVRPGDWEPASGYEQTLALLDLPNPPDAIFCANDLIAMGAYDAIRERGLRIPEDVSVVGFDDREIAQFMRPGLTTFQLPQFDMGRLAAEQLFEALSSATGNGATTEHRPQLKVECPFVERASCRSV